MSGRRNDPVVAGPYLAECANLRRAIEVTERRDRVLRDRRAVLWLEASRALVTYGRLAEASGVSEALVRAETTRAKRTLDGALDA